MRGCGEKPGGGVLQGGSWMEPQSSPHRCGAVAPHAMHRGIGDRCPQPCPEPPASRPTQWADAGSHRLSPCLDLLLPGQINYPAEKSLNPTIKPV